MLSSGFSATISSLRASPGSMAGSRPNVNVPLTDYRSLATTRPLPAHKGNLCRLSGEIRTRSAGAGTGRREMRTTLLIERYRKFAARTRLSMALLALSLFAAIGVILVAGAHAAGAGFLDSEARNIASLNGSGDATLAVVAVTAFLVPPVLAFIHSRFL